MKKMRKLFPLQNLGRSTGERAPLNPQSDRTVSNDSISTTSSTSSNSKRISYGSFLPSYFKFFRNSLRRSASSQVCSINSVCLLWLYLCVSHHLIVYFYLYVLVKLWFAMNLSTKCVFDFFKNMMKFVWNS